MRGWTKENVEYILSYRRRYEKPEIECPCNHIVDGKIDSCQNCPYIEECDDGDW